MFSMNTVWFFLLKIVPVCTTPASKTDASGPVALPLSVATSAMIPLKKRQCKPKEARPPLVESPKLDVKEEEAAQKVRKRLFLLLEMPLLCYLDFRVKV